MAGRETTLRTSSRFKVDGWEVHPDRNCLAKDGKDTKLEPRVMAVLVYLAERAGQVVKKNAILDSVWGGVHVGDEALSNAVWVLRKTFDDHPKAPRVIETVPKSGYRLIAPVTWLGATRAPTIRSMASSLWRLALLRPELGWVLALVASGVALVGVLAPGGDRPALAPAPAPTLVRFEIPLHDVPKGLGRVPFDISPDARQLAYVDLEEGHRRLFLRRIDSFSSTVIEGTEGARAPFFSADSEWIGFQKDQRLYKVSVNGGVPVAIGPGSSGTAVSWGPSGQIVTGGSIGTGLMRLSPDGNAVPLTTLQPGETAHVAPELLPGERRLLFTNVVGGGSSIDVLDLETGARRELVRDATAPRFARGQLLFARSGSLFAAPFDPHEVELESEPVPVLDGVRRAGRRSMFAIADDGTIVYLAATLGVNDTLLRVDRNGEEVALYEGLGVLHAPRVSPNGDRLAVTRYDRDSFQTLVGPVAPGELTPSPRGSLPLRFGIPTEIDSPMSMPGAVWPRSSWTRTSPTTAGKARTFACQSNGMTGRFSSAKKTSKGGVCFARACLRPKRLRSSCRGCPESTARSRRTGGGSLTRTARTPPHRGSSSSAT